MKRWLRWIGMGLAVAGSVVFMGYVLSSLHVENLRSHLSPAMVGSLLACILIYSMVIPLGAFAWKQLLAGMGHRVHFRTLNTILLATQAGKYLPGNIGQHIGRIGLSLSQGIPAPLLVASMAYEVVLLLLADVLTAIASGAMSKPGLQFLLQGRAGSMAIAISVAVIGIAAIPLLARLLPMLVEWIMSKGNAAAGRLRPLRMKTILIVVGIDAFAMLCVGASISVLALGLLPGIPVDFALLTAAFTIAWAVGFVTPGAPAGIGVREALLLLMLGPSLGAANASLLILALRIATTLGDMLCFAIGFAQVALMRRKNTRTPGPAS